MHRKRNVRLLGSALSLALALWATPGLAVVPGIPVADGATLSVVADETFIKTGDGLHLQVWAFGAPAPQYPGPTLKLTRGSSVSLELSNNLDENTSMVFPGMSSVAASCAVPADCVTGLVTTEVVPGGTITYTFTASDPGTYLYQSGTDQALQVEMGLHGAIVVYPATAGQAYDDTEAMCPTTKTTGPSTVVCSSYDREFLITFSDADERIHSNIQDGKPELVDTIGDHRRSYWFMNGRNFSDTLLGDDFPVLPTQPYGSDIRMHPGDRVLVRLVGHGKDCQPFHTHGNHMKVIAEDGRLRESVLGANDGPNLAVESFTYTICPGKTADAIFSWSGEKLGWDIYGHDAGDALETDEYAPDHGKPFPAPETSPLGLTFGGWWSGSPFLGKTAPLPPLEGGNNPTGGFPFFWHSHRQISLVNNDIFPGGLLTIMFVEHPDEPLP